MKDPERIKILQRMEAYRNDNMRWRDISTKFEKCKSWAAIFYSRNKHLLDQPEPMTAHPIPVTDSTLLQRYACILWEYAKANGVQEPRVIDIGRFIQDLDTEFTIHRKAITEKLVNDGILAKGIRGGLTLS